jgi:hypothetical protein
MSAEQRVLTYFLLCFFGAAFALAGYTWWRKAQACSAQCIAGGSPPGTISLSGGGRFNMSMVCRCSEVKSPK